MKILLVFVCENHFVVHPKKSSFVCFCFVFLYIRNMLHNTNAICHPLERHNPFYQSFVFCCFSVSKQISLPSISCRSDIFPPIHYRISNHLFSSNFQKQRSEWPSFDLKHDGELIDFTMFSRKHLRCLGPR